MLDERTPERQVLTQTTWDRLGLHDVYVSEVVLQELSLAPGGLRERLLELVVNFGILQVTEEIESLANHYVDATIFPRKYFDDALHAAIASVHRIDYLLSWNFRHLVKVNTRRLVSATNVQMGYSPVEIISPPEL